MLEKNRTPRTKKAKSEPITIAEREAAEVRLEERRRHLLDAWRAAQRDEGELLEDRSAERNEQAADLGLADLVDRVGEHEVGALREVVDALRKLHAGTWGVCEICAEPIPRSRRGAMPEARSCADCGAVTRSIYVSSSTDGRGLDEIHLAAVLNDVPGNRHASMSAVIRAFEPEFWGTCDRCETPLSADEEDFCEECAALTGVPLWQISEPPDWM